jgi:hypothetical protein
MLDSSRLAVLHYEVSDFSVVRPGDHVLCAVTGEAIPLDALVYWSAAHQEAYRGAAEATAALTAGGAANLPKG